MRRKIFSTFLAFLPLLGTCGVLYGCTIEHAEEQVLEKHVNGTKKTSVWVYPDGEILKRNEWYDNGIKEFEIQYKNNVPHGKIKRWTVLGDVALDGEYKNGKREGTWTSYFVERLNSRRKEAVRHYKDDHPVGDWEGWHFNGNKAFEEHYDENGNATGVWKKWHENGNPQQEGTCHARWEPNREIKSAPEMSKKSYLKRYSMNGALLEKFTCHKNKLYGPFELYYENFSEDPKTERIRIKGTLGFRLDETTFYGPASGDSALIGTITYYRADGSLMKQEFWTSGKRDSVWRWYDEHGELLRESNFTTSTIHGFTKSTGISYGTCENSSTLFCAETSFVQSANPSGTLDSSTLSFKDAYQLSIGKYPASLRYIKVGHVLLYEEFWAYDDPPSSFGDPALRVSRSFYPDSMGGGMASLGYWANTKRHGIWRNWYPNGILKDSLNYVNGERVGEQFGYDSTGKLTIHKTEAGKNRPVIMHLPVKQ